MSAATALRDGTVREAHAVLHVAMEVPDCKGIRSAMAALGDALDVYAGLDGDGLHWEQVYPELRYEAGTDGERDEALRKAAAEVDAAARDLAGAMRGAGCWTGDGR